MNDTEDTEEERTPYCDTGLEKRKDKRSVLTVGHTLILDLQIFVGSWTWVREHI